MATLPNTEAKRLLAAAPALRSLAAALRRDAFERDRVASDPADAD